MFTAELSTSRAPILNISETPSDIAIARALTCERVHIAIDHIEESRTMVLPVRIIEGMGKIVDRGTVNKKQATLLSSLVALLRESPILAR